MDRYTTEQIEGFLWRRPTPSPIPAPGDRVLYRHDIDGPVEPAQVTYVGSLQDTSDPEVWIEYKADHPDVMAGHVRPGRNIRRDPWVLVHLRTDANPGQERQTREARVPGSAGWLWPDDVVPSTPYKPVRVRPRSAIETLPEEQEAVAARKSERCGYTCGTDCHGGHVCLRAKHVDEEGHRTEHVAEMEVVRDGETVTEFVTWCGPCKDDPKPGRR